ncbi:phage repressor protein CI [Enterobacter sp. E-TC7]|uniref:Phage repressor protein CI n=1 Tax=Enterobacter nematophilus TaxID=2994648 RepID=A0ABT3VY46_9ENTR|nr:phage repressor protein CI [Enterobacter nematophilus]MCX5574423.1 phage repressor protein CI [Enterobacter nematophilus]
MSTQKLTKQDDFSSIRDAIANNRGGREVIERILKAYGFSTRISLCKQLGVSQSTMANRYSRDTFPADWVIVCHLETGASLQWLSTGQGAVHASNEEKQTVSIKHIDITNGIINPKSDVFIDKALLPEGLNAPFLLTLDKTFFLADSYDGELVDGYWFIEIDRISSVREVYRFPGGRVRIENGKASFECNASDVKVLGKIITKTEFII